MTDYLDEDVESVFRAELVSRAQEATQALLQAAQQVLTGPRSGRIYPLPGGGTYQASAPGEPPAERTDAFRASWTGISPVITFDGDTVSVTTGIRTEGVEYGLRFDPSLEPYLGGPTPRPFVQPILDLAQPAIDTIYAAPFGARS